jgi:hypothetical protein
VGEQIEEAGNDALAANVHDANILRPGAGGKGADDISGDDDVHVFTHLPGPHVYDVAIGQSPERLGMAPNHPGGSASLR